MTVRDEVMEHHWTDGGMRDGLVVAGITENNKEARCRLLSAAPLLWE